MAIRSIFMLVMFSNVVSAQEAFELVNPLEAPGLSIEIQPTPPPEPTRLSEVESADDLMTDEAPSRVQQSNPPTCQPCRSKPNRLTRWWRCTAEPHLRASHWGYPEYFSERPFGSYLNHTFHAQAINGRIAQQVLYQYDFVNPAVGNAAELSSRGRTQLLKLVPIMLQTGYPLVIQRTENAQLDEERRELILQHLANSEIDVTPDMVLVKRAPVVGIGGIGEQDFPKTPGWNVIYENRLKQTLDGGSTKLLQEFAR